MNRKQMIETIAQEAGCSKRLVRKKLFGRSAELKRKYKNVKFNEAFLDSRTDWINKEDLMENWKDGKRNINPWKQPNTFDVCYFPSGCVVMFNVKHVDNDGYEYTDNFGTRLYTTKVTL